MRQLLEERLGNFLILRYVKWWCLQFWKPLKYEDIRSETLHPSTARSSREETAASRAKPTPPAPRKIRGGEGPQALQNFWTIKAAFDTDIEKWAKHPSRCSEARSL